MLGLKQFRDRAAGVADLLNWAALVDDGIVQCKDGSLLAGWFYAGPDTDSATPEARNYLTERINAALSRLGSGWASWHDAVRIPSVDYPAAGRSAFPDRVTGWIDAERRQQFEAEGAHYESEYAMVVQYLPPPVAKKRFAEMMYIDDHGTKGRIGDRTIAVFKKVLADLEDSIGDAVRLRRMGSYAATDPGGGEHFQDELLNYLNFTLTGQLGGINVPPGAMYLDAVLGGQELWGGDTPRYGDDFIACVAIEGFPSEGQPGLLGVLDQLPFAYRWSTRMIYLEAYQALEELRKYRRKWKQRQRGFFSQLFKTSGGVVDEDAVMMTAQSETAMAEANSAMVKFGHYTAVVVLAHPSRDQLVERSRIVVREVQRFGFACRIETINTMEAWLGSLPGHGIANVRRPFIHTINLSDLLPLSSVWPGRSECPNPLYPAGSPPLLHGATSGATPFRVNLHVGDVGHTLILGPTGTGKSVLLATLVAQFRRYPRATICCFDKGRSMWALVEAAGGRHYDIGLGGGDGKAFFAPLAHLEEGDIGWAAEWIATCFELQTTAAPTPLQRSEIFRALEILQNTPDERRSLTSFVSSVQDAAVRHAMEPYLRTGSFGALVDSRVDGIADSSFTVFELEELMTLGDKVVIPVLLHLFRRFERGLRGQPALLVLDEAWLMLGHPVFREKIREWLKTLRKANCSVVLATQSLSDTTRSGIFDVLVESCPTKILLPNEEADKAGTAAVMGPADLYRLFGLNDREIEILRTAIRKRQYYFVSPEGRRLFELGLGPIARAFVAVSDKEDLAHLAALKDQHGAEWPEHWLIERGVNINALSS